jgi:hypothetical protein
MSEPIDPREKRLAELVLELEALKAERRALMHECKDRIDEKAEQVEKLARNIRSGQLSIEGGPSVEIVGVRK